MVSFTQLKVSGLVTWHRPVGIRYVATSDDATATTIDFQITTSPNPAGNAILGATVVSSAGVEKTSAAKLSYDPNSGIVTLSNNGAFIIAADDVVNLQVMYIS